MTQESLRIVLVEDSEIDADLIRLAVERGGLAAEIRRVDSEAALLESLGWPPNLVIADFNLPQFDGLRVVELVKASGRKIPVIVVSGALGEEAAVEVVRSGALDFLLKDRLTRLPAAIRQALEHARLELEAEASRQALAESQRVLATLASNLPGMAYRCANDAAWTMLYVSDGCFLVTGYDRAELEANRVVSYGDLVHPDDRDQLWAKCQASLAARKPCANEYRIIHRSGAIRWVSENARGVYDEAGRLTHIEGFVQDVTERKSAVEALRRSEDMYRTLVTTSPDAIVVAGLDGRVRFASMQARRLFDFGLDSDPANIVIFDHVAPVDRARASSNFRRILSDGVITSNVYRMRRASGTEFDGEVNSSMILGSNGAADGLMVITRDVTARREAEEALRESEARFSTVFHENPVGTALSRLSDGVFVDANNTFLEIFGFERDEIIGRTSEQTQTWIDRQQREEILARLTEHHVVRNVEVRHRRKDGREIDLLTSLALIEVGSERYVLGMLIDNSQAKKAVETLRESEERFRQVVESIHEVFWMVDVATDRVIYVSPGFEKIWARSCAAVLSERGVWVESIHPEDRARVMAAAREKQTAGRYDEQYRINRPDGAVRWIHDKAFPVRDAAGAVVRLVGIAEDITERKSLEQQFLRVQRLESIGTLASGIAHDLNNILAPIMMSAPLLRWNLPPAEEEKLLGTIETSARRGSDLVRQLLTFGKGAEGNRAVIQPDRLVRDIVKVAQQTFAKNIRVVTQAKSPVWNVRGDPTQLNQVLLNLCVNSRDAMPDGGVLTVEVENAALDDNQVAMMPGARAGDYVLFRVTDTGFGIPADVIDKIFDPFFTTKEAGKGTGLGLATVAGIVKGHAGFVTVRSEPNRGTSFGIYVPAERDENARADSEVSVQPAARGSGELVLVVEDEENIREVLRETLARHGYQVLLANDGADATARYAQSGRQIRLVITDLDMPIMDGVAMIRVLKRMNPAVRIMVSSGVASAASRADARRAELRDLGVETILVKPYTSDDLLRAVATLLKS